MKSLNRFSDWLTRRSTGRVALVTFAIFILFVLFVLPGQGSAGDSAAGDVGIPDLLFFYSPQTLYEMAEAYGAQGRAEYIHGHLTFDVIWPLIYTAFLITGISWAFGRITGPGSHWRRANLVPLVGILFDFSENLSTSWVVYRYPHPADFAAYLAAFSTAGKWIFAALGVLLMFIGLVGVLWQVIRPPSRGNY